MFFKITLITVVALLIYWLLKFPSLRKIRKIICIFDNTQLKWELLIKSWWGLKRIKIKITPRSKIKVNSNANLEENEQRRKKMISDPQDEIYDT